MKIIDLFSGAGGAAMGLHQAFPDAEIIGVDIEPQPRYPFTFVQADALTYPLEGADLVWASPPCQHYSVTRHLPGRASIAHRYADLVAATRERLRDWGGPWIIENVPGAPLLNGVTLCGTMFGLHVYRHRSFESSHLLMAPWHEQHVYRIQPRVNGRAIAGHYGPGEGGMLTVAGHLFGLADGRAAMGIDWMQKAELAESIPPAYSAYLAPQIASAALEPAS